MKIAVVGATGNIGRKLTHKLLETGHEVRALSRGGAALDELVELGAEPYIGSFQDDSTETFQFFKGCEAAFTMVKTKWEDLHGHYPAVAARMLDALRRSSVEHVVNLSSLGGETAEGTGHYVGFHDLEQGLNRYAGASIVHLRAGYFMENLLAWVDSIALYHRMAYYYEADVKLPLIATSDIAAAAFEELTRPDRTAGDTIREVGGEDLSMQEIAETISSELGRAVDYVHIPTSLQVVGDEFIKRFGTEEKRIYDVETHDAVNDGRVRLNPGRPPVSVDFVSFIHEIWRPAYERELGKGTSGPENFRTWLAGFSDCRGFG